MESNAIEKDEFEAINPNLAAPQGFEPRYADPESAVLPLNEGAASTIEVGLAANLARAPLDAGPEEPTYS
jgi:hypothetical protein